MEDFGLYTGKLFLLGLAVCPAVRLYWFIRPERKPDNLKLLTFFNIVTLVSLTVLLQPALHGLLSFVPAGVTVQTGETWAGEPQAESLRSDLSAGGAFLVALGLLACLWRYESKRDDPAPDDEWPRL